MTTRIPAPVPGRSADTAPAGAAAKALAALRIATGLIFLWAFLDKLFGLGYATPGAKAWIAGGSPTKGFLSSVDAGPFTSVFHAIAGTWWADWLFMTWVAAVFTPIVLAYQAWTLWVFRRRISPADIPAHTGLRPSGAHAR